MCRNPKPLLLRSDAAEIAEAALVLPLVFMFLLGIVWFGRAFNIYSTIQQAAQQGAITAARETCATCSPMLPPASSVTAAVENVLSASDLQVSQIIADSPTNLTNPCPYGIPPSNPPCTTATDNVTICYNVQVNTQVPTNSNAPMVCGTAVVFQYPFQFYLPFTSLNMQKITLTAQAQSRMEN